MRGHHAVQSINGAAHVARWMVGLLLVAGLLAPSTVSAKNYLYAVNASLGTVSTFSIARGGTLSQQGTGVATGSSATSGPAGVVVAPTGQHVYVVNSNAGTVSTFAIGRRGTLTQQGPDVVSGSSTSSAPASDAVSPNGRDLYVVNVRDGTVSTFSIGTDGTLTQQGTGVISGPGPGSSSPVGVVVSPDGRYVYVTNYAPGTVSTFSIGANGTLTQQGTGVASGLNRGPGYYPGPELLAVSPNGHNLYDVNFNQGSVSTFSIGASGMLTQQGTGLAAEVGPGAVAISPSGQELYVTDYTQGTVSSFSIGADGALTDQGDVPSGLNNGNAGLSEPSGVAVSPNGKSVYVANIFWGTVSSFSVAAGGTITQQGSGVASGTGGKSGPVDVVVSPDQGPTATYSTALGPAGSVSSFDAQASTAGSQPIATYAWRFGDGTTTTGPIASHVYKTPGTYKVTLRLTDTDGCSVLGPFTGRSPYCVSDPAASTSQTIRIRPR